MTVEQIILIVFFIIVIILITGYACYNIRPGRKLRELEIKIWELHNKKCEKDLKQILSKNKEGA